MGWGAPEGVSLSLSSIQTPRPQGWRRLLVEQRGCYQGALDLTCMQKKCKGACMYLDTTWRIRNTEQLGASDSERGLFRLGNGAVQSSETARSTYWRLAAHSGPGIRDRSRHASGSSQRLLDTTARSTYWRLDAHSDPGIRDRSRHGSGSSQRLLDTLRWSLKTLVRQACAVTPLLAPASFATCP